MFFRRREVPKQILCVQSLKACFGDLAAALSGVNLYSRQLVEPLDWQDHRLAVPVCRQQVAEVVCFSLAGNVDGVPPVTATGGQEQV